ncbi:MAG TPA: TVP38/TMEM64 family protein [Solirubrobacteraceae bacterium]|nr:TVP38/TMEM64 family protein [Solirubrobacteraceae bacterium]
MKRPPSGAPGRRSALIRLALLGLAVALAVAVIVLVVQPTPGAVRSWVDDVRDRVDALGPLAPLLFIAVSASLTTLMFPGPLLAGASGLLFGTALGFPVSLTSAVLGASLAFVISRSIAPDAVQHLAGPRLTALEALVSRRGFLAVLYARIVPGVPYTLVNYAAGLTRIPLAAFAAATALGAAPRAFAYTALGGSLGNLRSPETAFAVAVLVAMALAGVVLIARERRRPSSMERDERLEER